MCKIFSCAFAVPLAGTAGENPSGRNRRAPLGKSAAAALTAWHKGRTGYPIVDAGLRQLWVLGWMHNRVRMVAASFLTKHLLVPWQDGEAWFWDTLVDADLANNAASWQWVAGSGADAAPYFPHLQLRPAGPPNSMHRAIMSVAGCPSWGGCRPSTSTRPGMAPADVLAKLGCRARGELSPTGHRT